jgi:hypothetical protein
LPNSSRASLAILSETDTWRYGSSHWICLC